MPKSVARKASKKPTKSSKRRSVPKRMRRKSSKRTTKKQRGRGLFRRSKSSKKSPKRRSSKKSPKRKRSKSSKKMKGGASLYGFDLNDNIGGLPAVVKSLNCRGQPGSNLNK